MKKIKEKSLKVSNGITLIALVITIIVLLILAGISISMLSGDNSILQKATDAKTNSDNAQIKERIQLAYHSALTGGQGSYTKESLEEELEKEFGENNYNVDDSNNTNWILTAQGQSVIISAGKKLEEKEEPIENYVGCYIYKDGQYAIIYADLLAQQGTTLTLSTSNTSKCVFPTATASEFKTYAKSSATITPTSTASTGGVFGSNYQITEVINSNGKDRFLAMALTDLASKPYYFYYNAYGNMTIDTAKGSSLSTYDIGGGITNTQTMISKWNLGNTSNGGYGNQTTSRNKGSKLYYDMWEDIQSYVDASATETHTSKWYVPSFTEWVAFAKMTWTDANSISRSITASNYTTYGMKPKYWSSSQYNSNNAWYVSIYDGCMKNATVQGYTNGGVRLNTTF